MSKPQISRLSAVIVYGPPASGKTRNKEAIAKALRCDEIMDEASIRAIRGRIAKRGLNRILILTNDEKTVKEAVGLLAAVQAPLVRIFPISAVCKSLRAQWLGPPTP